MVRKIGFDLQPIFGAHPFDDLISFLVKPAGIEGENSDRAAKLGDHIDEHHVLHAETGSQPSLKAILVHAPA